MATKIGLVGLGRMGRAIQARLKDSGFDVIGWDRDAVAMQAAAANGMEVAAHPRAVADGSGGMVISIITEDSGVKNVFRGTDGFLSGDVRGKLFIEMSTVRPEVQIALAKVVRASGGRFVECPVGGTTGPARQGKLFGFMGAEAADAEAAKPILEQLCRRLEHVGPVGSGALAKFTINMPLMIYYQALGEAMAMARPLGLEPERLLDMIADSSGGPNMMKTRAPTVAKMMKGEDTPVTFDLAGCIKDLQSMQAEGKARGITLPLVQMTLACMEESVSKGLGAKEAAMHSVYWAKK